MRQLLHLTLFTCIALLHMGCASTSVKLHDTVGNTVAKGFAEFYVGVSGGETVTQCPQSFVDVNHEDTNVEAACGAAMGHAFGGTRLRVACEPGLHTFRLSPSFVEGTGSGQPQSVTVNIAEGKVTPVRVTVHVLSVERSSGGYNNVTITWIYRMTAVAGEPQLPYDVASMTYRYKDGTRVLWMAGTVCTVVIEGKDTHQVQNTKQRLDRAHNGLNMGVPRDREEFKRRYGQNTPEETLPQGIMVRITTLNGLSWLPAFVLTE